MTQVSVYTDEDIVAELAIQLRLHGYDAISCREARNHNRQLDDEWQLEYATSQGRAILTRNAVDFIRLDMQWKSTGREHAGIICLSRNPTIAEMVMKVRTHLDRASNEQQHNTLYWA